MPHIIISDIWLLTSMTSLKSNNLSFLYIKIRLSDFVIWLYYLSSLQISIRSDINKGLYSSLLKAPRSAACPCRYALVFRLDTKLLPTALPPLTHSLSLSLFTSVWVNIIACSQSNDNFNSSSSSSSHSSQANLIAIRLSWNNCPSRRLKAASAFGFHFGFGCGLLRVRVRMANN